jgi:hypothetical protein
MEIRKIENKNVLVKHVKGGWYTLSVGGRGGTKIPCVEGGEGE